MGGCGRSVRADKQARHAAVHVVSADHAGLLASIAAACGQDVDVRRFETAPRLADVAAGDMVVVDLDSFPPHLDPAWVGHFSERAAVLVVASDHAVRSAWLLWATTRLVQVTICAEETGYASAVAAVKRHFSGPPAAALIERLATRYPDLTPAADMIAALYAEPCAIRRPAQMARALDCAVNAVHARSQALGFARGEHLLTALRAALYRCLVEYFRKPKSVARSLAGIADPSNFQRQLRRARHSGSAVAAQLLTTVLILVAVATAVQGCGRAAQDDGQASATSLPDRSDSAIALPVVGAVVRRGDLVLSVRATGVVRAERLVSIRPETQGTVAEVLVRPGERVSEAHVLVRLDLRPFDLAVREAESAVGSAQMQYAEAMLGTAEGDTSEAARMRRENARLRSGIIAAEARLERARLDREHATIRAPFGGVLDDVGVVAGQRVGPSDLVARLVDLSALTVEASVLEHDLALMRVGAEATVTPSASRDTRLLGRVIAVLPLVDTTTRAGRVLVRVRTPDGALRPGMYADVELEATRLRNRIVVPAAAVIERDGRPLVFRARGGRAEWVYLIPGRSNGLETDVAADSTTSIMPIAPGDTVLIAGHLTLTHDAPVRVQLRETPQRLE